MKYTYEFRNIEYNENQLEVLNKWGEDGWEVVWFNWNKRQVYEKAGDMAVVKSVPYIECLLKRVVLNGVVMD